MTDMARHLGVSLVLWIALCLHVVQAQEPLHITHAELLSTSSSDASLPPYEVRSVDLKGEWRKVTLPYVMPQLPRADDGKQASEMVSWYRLQLPALSEPAGLHYLYIPRWRTQGRMAVYGDQRLLFQSHADLFWNGWNIPLWIALDETANVSMPREILVRVVHPGGSSADLSTVWVGDQEQLNWRYHLRYLLQARMPYMVSLALLAAGGLSLLVWLMKRGESLHLLFFLSSVISILRTLRYIVGENPLFSSHEWFTWLTVNSLFWLITVLHLLLNQLHQRPTPAMDRIVVFSAAALGVLTAPLLAILPSDYLESPLAFAIFLTIGIAVASVGLYKSSQARSVDGSLLSAWCFAGLLFWLSDWLMQCNLISMEGIYLGPYTNLVAFVLFLNIMRRRYAGALNEVKQVNANLSLRLQEREAELRLIHAEQRDAAHRQTLASERQRMMQDMHDGMGSSLRTALLSVERGQLDAPLLAEVLKDCIDDLKLAIDAMEPVQADLLLLLATLRFRLGPRLEGTGITLHWDVENVPDLDWLDPRNALHILRILQEAFTNIIKHTHASRIRVATRVRGNEVVVSLTDNGQGFDVARGLANPGKGLKNQLRRAEAIGADIQWASSATGVCVSLRLPICRALA
jgi:signal transduction histidine kinase